MLLNYSLWRNSELQMFFGYPIFLLAVFVMEFSPMCNNTCQEDYMRGGIFFTTLFLKKRKTKNKQSSAPKWWNKDKMVRDFLSFEGLW